MCVVVEILEIEEGPVWRRGKDIRDFEKQDTSVKLPETNIFFLMNLL